MKKWLGIIVTLVIVALVFIAGRSSKPSPESKSEAAATAKKETKAGSISSAGNDTSREKFKSVPTTPERVEEVSEIIINAVSTYVPAGAKLIQPYLLDPDPEIRTAAREGMVQLGESDGIPLLRDAASKLSDPLEIAEYHKAADMLELPSWSTTDAAKKLVQKLKEESADPVRRAAREAKDAEDDAKRKAEREARRAQREAQRQATPEPEPEVDGADAEPAPEAEEPQQ
jgi:hypothetical protein